MKTCLAPILALSLVMGGCAMRVNTRVTAFHMLPNQGDGRTFAVLPLRKELTTSLEAATYAVQIGRSLEKHGYRMIRDTNTPPALVVWYAYGIDSGRTTITSAPEFGQISGGYETFSGTIYSGGQLSPYVGSQYTTPQFGVTGYSVASHLEFTRFLDIIIVDKAASLPGKPRIVYEARAISSGRSNQLGEIVPHMISKVFADFPGHNGATR